MLHNQVFCNCSKLFQCFTIRETKNWNRRMEQKAEELYEDGWYTSQTTFLMNGYLWL